MPVHAAYMHPRLSKQHTCTHACPCSTYAPMPVQAAHMHPRLPKQLTCTQPPTCLPLQLFDPVSGDPRDDGTPLPLAATAKWMTLIVSVGSHCLGVVLPCRGQSYGSTQPLKSTSMVGCLQAGCTTDDHATHTCCAPLLPVPLGAAPRKQGCSSPCHREGQEGQGEAGQGAQQVGGLPHPSCLQGEPGPWGAWGVVLRAVGRWCVQWVRCCLPGRVLCWMVDGSMWYGSRAAAVQ